MKSLFRIMPLLLSILLFSVLSWVSIYAYWFGVWFFHNVAAARACDAVGEAVLAPARFVFSQLSGGQPSIFFDQTSYAGTNGLILGVIARELSRFIPRRPQAPAAPAPLPREEAPIG